MLLMSKSNRLKSLVRGSEYIMNDEQQQELYRAIVINPFKESDDQDQDLEALKQSAIDLYNDIMSALNEAENESESESENESEDQE